jgi:hypothetical protein
MKVSREAIVREVFVDTVSLLAVFTLVAIF